MKPSFSLRLLLLGSSLLAISYSHAANIWDGGGADANWNTINNWDNNALPGTGALTFTGDVQTSTNNNLVAVDPTFGGINFTNDGSAGKTNAFTLTGSRVTLGGNITTTANTAGSTITDVISLNMILNNTRTITTNQLSSSVQHNLTISGIISETGGARGITKAGGGVLTLSGQNSYTGVTTVNLGTLRAGAAAGGQAFGNGSAVTLANTAGVILDLNGFNQTIGNLTGGAASTITLGSGNLTVNQAGTTTHAGTISGAGGLIKTGVGTLTLSNTSNDYTGGTRIDGGLLLINADAALGESSDSVTLNGGGLAIGTTLSSTRGLILNNVAGNLVRLQGNQIWTTSGALTGDGGVIFRQNPNGIVSAYLNSTANDFKGALGIESNNGGITVRLRSLADSSTANGNIIYGLSSVVTNSQIFEWDSGAGAALNLNNRKFEFAQNGTAFSTIKNSHATNAITVNTDLVVSGTGTKNLTLEAVAGPTNVFDGDIGNGSGTVALTKSGAGTWTLSGNNSYSGATTISAGTLVGIGASAFGSTSGISMAAAGTLSLRGDSSTTFTSSNVTTTASGVTVNVDQATIAGTGAKTMTMGTLGTISTAATYQLNFTGANNTSLGLGAVTGAASTAAATVTLANNIAAGGNLTLASYTSANTTGGETVTFSGTGNTTVTGAVTPGAATLNLRQNGSGILTLNGSSTYTGITTISSGVVEAATLDIGGNNSSIGKSSNDAANLVFGTSTATLRYTGGSNVITDRGFSTSTGAGGGATIESSGAGTLSFNNTVAINYGTTNQTRTLTLGGTNTGANTFGKVIANNGIGATSLSKTGVGTWALSGDNSYTGATNVNAGTLAISGTGDINSTSAINVTAGATFAYNSSTALTVAPTLNGTGTGAGQRAVLGGTGPINTAITLNNLGDTLSPGNSPGIMSFETGQTWASFGYDWELNDWAASVAGTNIDQIGITGSLTLSAAASGSYLLNILSLTGSNVAGNVPNFAESSKSWTILTTTSGISGFDASYWNLVTSGFSSSPTATGTWSLGLANGDNDLVLTYAPIPEPRAALLGALGLLILLRRRR